MNTGLEKNQEAVSPMEASNQTVEVSEEDLPRELALAMVTLSPNFNAAGIVNSYSAQGKVDPITLNSLLRLEADKLKKGNLDKIENMLISQAHSLDAIFTYMVKRAYGVKIENLTCLEYFNRFIKCGLKAQSQCRATLETLANIKNPPNTSFVQQQNVAYQQQVNNQNPKNLSSRARKNKKCSKQTIGKPI